jgi:hypothetical protein
MIQSHGVQITILLDSNLNLELILYLCPKLEREVEELLIIPSTNHTQKTAQLKPTSINNENSKTRTLLLFTILRRQCNSYNKAVK